MSKINWYNEIANGLSQVLSPFQVEVGACLQVKDPFNRRLKSRDEPTVVASLNLIHEENLIVVESLRTTQLYQGLGVGRIIANGITQLAQKEKMCVELCAEGDGVYFWPKNGFLAADSSMNIGNGWVGDKIALSHGQILKTMKIYSSLDALELQDALKYNPVLKARASQLTPSPSLEGIGAACSESLEQQYDSYKGLVSAVAQSDSKDILWTVAEHPFGPILLPDSLIHMIWDPRTYAPQ
jgi:GNAT superfamily N-acetyltransferase